MDKNARDGAYVQYLLDPIRAIKNYQPKFGQREAVTLEDFAVLYGSDPLYHWVGFDSPLMYSAHRAAGAMTSLYRNLGTGCERLFKHILMDQFTLTAEEIKWSYVATSEEVGSFAGAEKAEIDFGDVATVAGLAESEGASPANKGKKNTLDGRFDLVDIKDVERNAAAADWIERLRRARDVTWEPLGAVFEIRQGYKSMDSKRQSADIANASQALSRQRMPVLVVMSSQIDDTLVNRYGASGWGLLRGFPEGNDPLVSTFAFFEQVLGYDLVAFFERNHMLLRSEVADVLATLLGEQ